MLRTGGCEAQRCGLGPVPFPLYGTPMALLPRVPPQVFLSVALACLVARPASADGAAARAIRGVLEVLERSPCVSVGGTPVESSPELLQLYRAREDALLWNDRSAVSDLRAAVENAEAQGLDPADYHADALEPAEAVERDGSAEPSARPTPRATAELDLLRTHAFVQLALDIRYGRTRRALTATEPRLDPLEMQRAIETGSVRQYLEGLQPQTELYGRLQQALAAYRRLERQGGGWQPVPTGPSLKPGASDPRLDAIRRLLEVTGDLPQGTSQGEAYDATLEKAVRLFQSRHGLDPDGVIGPATLEAMNVPVSSRVEQIRVSLERCRLNLRDLPSRFVLVNIAGYRVLLFQDGSVTWRSRVIVGTTLNETPEFRTKINAVIVNPTWTIPKSIVRGEILPDSSRDPGYMQRKRISRVGDDYVQAAGPGNALGRLKLSMPNEHSVYLHDTPTKALFGRAKRTFSHGCVRVEKPVELASLLLDDPKWSVKAIEAEIAKDKTRRIPLATPVPVLIQYWTVTVNRQGVVEFLPDIYGRDAALLRELAASRTCR